MGDIWRDAFCPAKSHYVWWSPGVLGTAEHLPSCSASLVCAAFSLPFKLPLSQPMSSTFTLPILSIIPSGSEQLSEAWLPTGIKPGQWQEILLCKIVTRTAKVKDQKIIKLHHKTPLQYGTRNGKFRASARHF